MDDQWVIVAPEEIGSDDMQTTAYAPSWVHEIDNDEYHHLVDLPRLKISWTIYHGLVISYKKEN